MNKLECLVRIFYNKNKKTPEPVEKGIELIEELNKYIGNSDWTEYSYMYSTETSKAIYPVPNDIDAILEKYGYDRDTAPFIYHRKEALVLLKHPGTKKIIGALEVGYIANIVKEAILNKDFDMKRYLRRKK
ncbi:MAG: hypothetical protein QXK76_03425 [Candidatus Woesearchaeota archaeon]